MSSSSSSSTSCVICSECNKSFSRRDNLLVHIVRYHISKSSREENDANLCNTPAPTSRIICPLCESETAFTRELHLEAHLFDSHDIELNREQKKFSNEDEFESWKEDYERSNLCQYVTRTSKKLKNGDRRCYMHCHRTGQIRQRGAGKRKMRSQGSNKIFAMCPSNMVVTKERSGSVDVEICTTHVGHSENLGRCFVSRNERAAIAAKLSEGVPYETVLDQIRDGIQDLKDPAALLTRQDMYNIKRDFKLHSERKHSSDFISVQLWVKKMMELPPEDSPIMFYKPQNEVDPNKVLDDEDVMLILGTKFQRECLLQFGKDKICIDSTHSTNAYDFLLTTLLVVDEFQNGLPCVFCISNRKDTIAWRLFYQIIKNDVGKISANIFMTDDDASFYNAWEEVMGPVPHRLLCSWHVDRSWRKQLQAKIKEDREKQIEVYKTLKVLQHEADEVKFFELLNVIVDQLLKDPITKEFGTYFKSYYSGRCQSWAYFARKGLGINTNMYLESVHKCLKYFYFRGRVNKRLDKCMDALMKFSRDKAFERLRKICKNKTPKAQTAVLDSHKKSKTLDPNNIMLVEEAEMWLIKSSTKSNVQYGICSLMEQCTIADCPSMCSLCNVCSHMYSCECVDYIIKGNTCKHLHAIQRFRSASDDSNIITIDVECDSHPIEKVHHLQEIICSTSKVEKSVLEKRFDDLETKMNMSKSMLFNIKEKLFEEQDEKKMNDIDQQLNNLLTVLHSSYKDLKTLSQPKVKSKLKEPPNKKVIPQTRFFSTKKKSTGNDTSYSFPTYEERHSIITDILN